MQLADLLRQLAGEGVAGDVEDLQVSQIGELGREGAGQWAEWERAKSGRGAKPD